VAKFWLSILTELRNRGPRDILIFCCDGLSGGRPGRRRAVESHLRETSRRMAGVTAKTSAQQRRGNNWDKAASHTRSEGV
jgi:hypothetical protein